MDSHAAGARFECGKLDDKYDVIDNHRAGAGGAYPLQDGFGWTNGVTRKLVTLYPANAVADHCGPPEHVAP